MEIPDDIESVVGQHNNNNGRFYPRKPDPKIEKTREEWDREGLSVKADAEPTVRFVHGWYKAYFYSVQDTQKAGRKHHKYRAARRVAQHLRLRPPIKGGTVIIRWVDAQDLYRQLILDHGWEYDREKEVWCDKLSGVEVGW